MSFGNTVITGTVELQNSSMVTPRLVNSRDYTPSVTEYVTSIRAYIRNSGGGTAYFRVGVYNVTGGDSTASRIAQWQIPVPVQAASWVTLSVASVTLTAGQTYNFAFCDDASNTITYYLYMKSAASSSVNIGTANRLLPNPVGSLGSSSSVDPLVEIITTTGQLVTSINGGNPIPAGELNVSAVTTGFTALPNTITTDASGLTCSNIGGTINAPEFDISDRVDGGLYPKAGTTVEFTFDYNGTETASGSEEVTAKDDETIVVIASPLFTANTLANAILDQTGRTVDDNDEFYHTTYSDLVITPDTDWTVTDAGSFDLWLYVSSGADAGKMFYYAVTITEGGAVVVPPTTRPLGGRPIRSSLGRQIWPITPHATNPVGGSGETKKAYGIKVSGAGTVVIRTEGGDEDVTITLAAGATLPVVVTHVRDTSTATGILGYSIY